MSLGCSDPITSACGLEHTKVRGQRAQVRSKVSNIRTNLQFSSVLAGGANPASVSIPPPPLVNSSQHAVWRRQRGDGDLMTRRHCFCNCAASDGDLSLALMAAADGSAPSSVGGSSRGQLVLRSPSGAQTGATGEIGIVLMAPGHSSRTISGAGMRLSTRDKLHPPTPDLRFWIQPARAHVWRSAPRPGALKTDINKGSAGRNVSNPRRVPLPLGSLRSSWEELQALRRLS